MLPLQIDGDLNIRVGRATVRLTPTEGLEAAEQLIRKSTRRMMLEEALMPIERDDLRGESRPVEQRASAEEAERLGEQLR